jgi:hypothetical protein
LKKNKPAQKFFNKAGRAIHVSFPPPQPPFHSQGGKPANRFSKGRRASGNSSMGGRGNGPAEAGKAKKNISGKFFFSKFVWN